MAPPAPEAWARQPLPALGGRSFLDAYNAPGGASAVEAYLQSVEGFERSLGTDEDGAGSSSARGRRRMPPPWPVRAAAIGVLGLILLFMLGAGGFLVMHSLVIVPREYDRLAAIGVPVKGEVVSCYHGRGADCWVSYTYEGVSRRAVYGQDVGQFGAVGSTVDLLVDPSDAATVFTVHDVRTRYVEAWEVVVGLFMLVGAAIVLVMFVMALRLKPATDPRKT